MTQSHPLGRRSCTTSSRFPSGTNRCGIAREVWRENMIEATCRGCLRLSRKPGERVGARLPPTRAFRSEASPRLRSHPRTRRGHTGARKHDGMRWNRVEAYSSASGSSSNSVSFEDSSGGLKSALNAFWRFLRPHTIRGTVLGTTALVARVLMENPSSINWMLMPRALIGLLALLCGNGYIVGINQIYDEEIDRVNKPFLPVAAGDLTKSQAWILVVALAVGGLSAVLTQFGALTAKLYTLGLFLGTIYSVPPLRLKRFALPAFLIIATVRGVLLNFGVYHATREALLLPFQWSPAAAFITIFATVFATVIAITKDLADVEGDKKFNIGTFATALGVRGVAFLGSGLLLANYMGAILAACVASNGTFRMAMMVGAHALFAVFLIKSTLKLDQARYTKSAVQEYYRAIWNLFYSEYVIFPFI